MHTRPSVLPAARQSTTGLSFLAAAGLLWGTGGFSGTLLGHVAGLSPLAIAAYRLAVGGGLIAVVLLATGRRLPRDRAAYLRVGLIGLLTAVYQASYFAAVTLTSVSFATLITIGSSPVIVLAVETVTGRRRLSRATLITLVLALAGLGLLVGGPTGHYGTAAMLGGAGLALLSATCFGTMSLACAAPIAGLDELTTTGIGFGIGGTLLLGVTVPTVGVGFVPTPAALGLVAFLALVPTAIAYVCYFHGLPAAGPGTAALFALLEPLVGSFLSVLFLHDRLGTAGWCGAALLMLAVALAARAAARR